MVWCSKGDRAGSLLTIWHCKGKHDKVNPDLGLGSVDLRVQGISTGVLELTQVKPPTHFHCVLHAKRGWVGPDSM